jgi:hypothetical protein
MGRGPLLCVPPSHARDHLPDGAEISYAEAAETIARLAAAYAGAGFGPGRRVATLLENRPDAVLHKLALNGSATRCRSITSMPGSCRCSAPVLVFTEDRFAICPRRTGPG